jgi:sugar O-acyltransferase (sialic acid O-acetyltransferase NeuD family)
MKDIYIIGCGGFAKEVYALIQAIGGYSVKGFINIEKAANLIFKGDSIPVLEEEAFLKSNIRASIAIGVGEPNLIKKLSSKYNKFDFPNLFHPNVVGDFDNIEIGLGNIFTANVNLTTCIKIGNFNIFNLSTTIGHDVEIGNYNVINPCVNVSGGVIIGDSNLIGVGATILQYKKIGSNSIVGAAALVIKNVPDSVTVFGIPAKRI